MRVKLKPYVSYFRHQLRVAYWRIAPSRAHHSEHIETSTAIPADYGFDNRRDISIFRYSTLPKLRWWIPISRMIHGTHFVKRFKSEEMVFFTMMLRSTILIKEEEVNEKCFFRVFLAILILQCPKQINTTFAYFCSFIRVQNHRWRNENFGTASWKRSKAYSSDKKRAHIWHHSS